MLFHGLEGWGQICEGSSCTKDYECKSVLSVNENDTDIRELISLQVCICPRV